MQRFLTAILPPSRSLLVLRCQNFGYYPDKIDLSSKDGSFKVRLIVDIGQRP
jgi:hypothetical protein